MNLNKGMKKAGLLAAVGAVSALAMVGPAHASVYGLSYVEIDKLQIAISGVGADPINTFNFDTQNTAVLNGVPAITIADCANASCSTLPDAAPAQLGTAQANNTFSLVGKGSEYSRADSVIITAQLVDGVPSHTQNIVESNLLTGTAASGTSTLQSTTGFSFSFFAGGPGTLDLSFIADIDLEASINDLGAETASSQASASLQFKLSNDDTGDFVQWNPTTVTAGDLTCSDAVIDGTDITCTTQSVAQNLNANVGVSSLPVSMDAYSVGDNFFGNYFLGLEFVTAGNYTLTLAETKSTLLTRTPIPEPASLLLMGTGLLGMGFARKAKKKA